MKFFAAAIIASLTFGLNLREMEEGTDAPIKQIDADFKLFDMMDNKPVWDGEGDEPEREDRPAREERDGEDMPSCASDEDCEKPKKRGG